MADLSLDMGAEGEDLYPPDEESQRQLVADVNRIFTSAERAKAEHVERWRKYYRMYRSWPGKRKRGEWKSRVWVPVSFYVVETIIPRLVAQLPKFTVYPVGPEDTPGAETMEQLLEWAADKSDLYLELVKAFKSALMYGTGIVKTTYEEEVKYQIIQQPVMQDQTMQVPTGQLDMDNAPIMQEMVIGQEPTGETEVIRQPYTSYAGPVGQAVDIDDFFPSPEATSVEDARYVIHRVYRTREHIEKMVAKGDYKLPTDDEWVQFLSSYEYPIQQRLASVELGSGSIPDDDGKLIEVLEVWTNDAVVTVAGKQVLLRAERNPFGHGEKPFIRIVDHLVPFEFWGIGELETLEGTQDTLNALWNSRVDNVKLTLNTMLAVSMEHIYDPADLRIRPGGLVRIKEGMPIDQILKPIVLPDVTSDAYNEAAEMERLSEKISGVSAYQMGMDSPSLNRTATGVALISEQGNTRFAHKTKIAELTGLRRLARHYGSILQQFMPPEMAIRIIGPQNMIAWQMVTPDSIQGAFDYDVESESQAQTESLRREQTLSLFQMLVAMPEVNRYALIEDVLKTFGRKDVGTYLIPPEQLMMMQQQQMAMEGGEEESAEAPPQF